MTEYLDLLKKLSSCRIVPGLKQPEHSLPLREILAGMPHFFAPGGGVFVGAESPEVVKPGKVCVCARLAGPGGLLKRGPEGKYFFAAVSGYPKPGGLLGRSLGVYAAETGEKLFELAVEHVSTGKDGAVLYFLPGAEKEKILAAAKEPAVCHPAEFSSSPENISGWNLSSLANAALALQLAKSGACCAWLSSSPLPEEAGLARVELDSFEEPGAGARYGFFDLKSRKLLTDLSALGGQAAGPLSVWLSVSNMANGNGVNMFLPEAIPAAELDDYAVFVGKAAKAFAEAARGSAPAASEPEGVQVADETAEIAAIVNEASDFAGFLTGGLPRLAAVFARHGLARSKAGGAEFEELRLKLQAGGVPASLSPAEIESLAARARDLVEKSFPNGLFFRTGKLKVVSLLMGNARVFSAGNGTIFISPDRPGGELKQLLAGELLYSFALGALNSLALPAKRARHVADGLRFCLLAGMNGGGLADALGLSGPAYEAHVKKLPEIKQKAEAYLDGEDQYLYEGKYHRYFKPKPAGAFSTLAEERFLAAHEYSEAVKQGKFYEKILS